MAPFKYRFSVIRVSVVILVAIAAAIPVPSAAQGRDKAKELSFFVFLQSVSAQGMARLCVRGLPDYRQRFDNLYARWSEKHHDRIVQGETAFREALTNKAQPYLDREKLQQVEKLIADLATSPVQTSQITLDDQWRAVCEQNLSDLEKML